MAIDVSDFKKEVRSQIIDLARLLYGQEPERWWIKSVKNGRTHLRNTLNILVKGRANYALMKNVIKAYAQIGFRNIQSLLFLQVRLVDEMGEVVKKNKVPEKESQLFKRKWEKPFFSLPEAEESDGMTSYERFNRAVDLKEADRIPFTPLMDYYYSGNEAVRMSPMEFVLGPFEKVFNAVKNTYNKFNGIFDMVHLPMGRLYAFINMLPLGPSGYYSELFYPDDIPSSMQFIEKGYIDVKDFERIKKDGLRSIWRPISLKKISDTQTDLIKIGKYINYWENIKKVPIYATSGIVTPAEGLNYLMGITNFAKAIRKNREEIKEICDLLLKGTMANNYMMYAFTQVKRTYICLERVSATFISPRNFEYFVLDNLLDMVKENVRHGLTTVFHMDTDWTPFFHYFLEFPKNGKYILHLEDSDIYKAKEMLGHRFCIMGNIQTKLLRFGTEQQIIDKTKELIDGCKEGGGYMMAEGCEVAPDTPINKMKVWIDTTLKYGQY